MRCRPGHDVGRLPWPSEVFVSFSLGTASLLLLLFLPVSLPLTEAATGTAQHLARLRLRCLLLLPHFAAVPTDAAATHAAVVGVVAAAAASAVVAAVAAVVPAVAAHGASANAPATANALDAVIAVVAAVAIATAACVVVHSGCWCRWCR